MRRSFSSLSGGQEEKLNTLANVNGLRQMTVISMQVLFRAAFDEYHSQFLKRKRKKRTAREVRHALALSRALHSLYIIVFRATLLLLTSDCRKAKSLTGLSHEYNRLSQKLKSHLHSSLLGSKGVSILN